MFDFIHEKMLVEINKISELGDIAYSTVCNRVCFYSIPIVKMESINSRGKTYSRKNIEERYIKYVLNDFSGKKLKDIVWAWIRKRIFDRDLLMALDEELSTMRKNELMRLCIKKKII